MGWIVSTVFAVVVCGLALVIGFAIRRRAEKDLKAARATADTERPRNAYGRYTDELKAWSLGGTATMVVAVLVFGLWVGISTFVMSFHQIPTGHVGVVYQFGGIIGQVPEGGQWVLPWQSVKDASIQVQTLVFNDDPSKVPAGARLAGQGLDSFSKETQNVYIDATLNIEVSPEDIQGLYRKVGPSYVDKIIPGRVNQLFKDETVNYAAVDIAPNREVIRANVEAQLRQELKPFSIDMVALLIDNIAFDPEFERSIEQKQIATQEALKARELVGKSRAEADQKIETARGDAESLRITAEGQAAANRLLAESLTPELIQFQMIQKLTDKIKIMLVPSGGGLILDPSKLFEEP